MIPIPPGRWHERGPARCPARAAGHHRAGEPGRAAGVRGTGDRRRPGRGHLSRQGQVTYAQASWVPDLAARFCAGQQPPADVRALLLGGDPGGDPGAVLLSCVSRAELQALLRSVIVDAIIALTVPLSGAAVSGIRFEA